MSDGLSIPLHLAVHLVGLAAVAGLVAYAVGRRRQLGPSWPGLALGGTILAVQHVATGLVLIDNATWPVYARAAAYAAIAVGVAGANTSAAMPVVVAIAPISVHVTAGIAGLLAAASALRGVARRGGLLASGIAAWAASDMLVRSRPQAAAVVAVIGSMFVLGWTSTAARTSVRARLLAVITVLVSFAVVLVAASTGTLFTDQFRQDAIERLRTPAASVADDIVRAWPRDMAEDVALLTQQPITIAILGRSGLGLREAEAIRRSGGAGDLVAVLDRAGNVVAGSWRGSEPPATWLTLISGEGPVQAAQTTTAAQSGTLVLRGDGLRNTVVGSYAARLVLADQDDGIDQRLGVVVLARLADATNLESRKRAGGQDFAVVAGDEVVTSTRDASLDPFIIEALDRNRPSLETEDAELLLAASSAGNVGVPVTTIAMQETGILADPDAETARELFQRSLLALLVGLLGGVIASRALARPVRRLTDVVDRVAAGDLTSSVPLENRADELGRLAEAFDDMTVALGARQAALQRAASTEAELRGRLQAITDSMSDGLIATDRAGRVTACNPAAARLAGIAVDDAVGANLVDVLRGDTTSGERLEEALAGVGDGEAPVSLEVRMEATGSDVAVTTSALRGSAGSAPILGSVIVLRDVSAEAELARARRDFVTNISHELRTPLTLIMAPVRQLEKWRTREDIAPIQSEILNRGTARMARLERELTEWAQLDLGRYANIKGEAHLEEVRKRSVDMVSWQYPDRDIRFKVPARLAQIAISTEAVTTIVRELTHNAVLFSKHKGGIVDVVFKNVPKGVELTVRDRGVGMTPETIKRAFEPYWQLDPTERRDFDGLGIGLTLAERVARAAGTRVTLTSRPGRGTIATVVFPVTRPPNKASAKKASQKKSGQKKKG